LNTATLANGYHELTAVVYEGTHVRSQGRATQNIRIQNTPLSATFTTLVGGINTAVEGTFQFSVVANTNNVATIELFSTGGSLGVVSNQNNAFFSVPAAMLGIGLHPFYAVLTTALGVQYRTETKWLRIVGPDSPFALSLSATPPMLSWPASAGRSYDVLSATNVTNAFLLRGTLTPSNSLAQWTETNSSAPQRFYRVRTSN